MAQIRYYQAASESSGISANQAQSLCVLASAFGDGEEAEFGLFMVAHGRDQQGGATTSTLVLRTITSEMLRKYYYPMLTEPSPPVLQETLTEAVRSADAEVRAKKLEGTSALTAAVVVNKHLHLAHLGNSRAYLLTEAGIEQLTTDHGMPGDDATKTAIRAVGYGNSQFEPDFVSRKLPPQARLLLVNKGYWSNDEIATMAMEHDTLEATCEVLIELAAKREAGDVAIVLIQIPDYEV